ncbi:GIN4 kinase Cdr1 [Pseudozyma hubeiensis SY62]|uniref:GIN4 kinase Cdr1 n=1 Tax=Pseudozyma hubeiensis (strain SY62) TaxID=1305764 RepID=R9PDT5_PSEHS|nr:GIN4 kinase Cdr1 [Pseudozyma hubeiensis SY62]GAC99543.1 GIN4 kinase Cdr1 [Pseudozyma hubeiensis SY62]
MDDARRANRRGQRKKNDLDRRVKPIDDSRADAGFRKDSGSQRRRGIQFAARSQSSPSLASCERASAPTNSQSRSPAIREPVELEAWLDFQHSTLDFQHRQHTERNTHAEQQRCSRARDSETRAIPSHRPCQSSHPSSLLHHFTARNDIAAHRLARSLRFC